MGGDAPKLILTVGKKVSPDTLEHACIQVGESLGYKPQINKNNGFSGGDIVITFNARYA